MSLIRDEDWSKDFNDEFDEVVFGPYEEDPVVTRPIEKRHHPLCQSHDASPELMICNCRELYDKDYES